MARPVRIACFGDSLTEGYGLEPEEALPSVLQEMLRDDGFESQCLNFGVSGDTSTDGLQRLNAVLEARPDIVVLEFGANDCFVGDSVATVNANLSAIITACQSHNIQTLLVGITAKLAANQSYAAEFDPLFKTLAAQHNIPLFPDILACYFSDPLLKLLDDLHPNAQGVRAMARELLPYVTPLISNHP